MIALEPGCVIVGKYRLERELASGGMGSLWVAFDSKLQRSVAVKFINPVAARHEGAVARFEREARVMAHIRSPHVVQTYDYGVDRGHAYMVMELLDGEDLGQRLAREGKLPVAVVSMLLGQIAKGLDAVHATGIIHRDLKPANIFLAQIAGDETVKLIDFGVARSERVEGERMTDAGVLVGTLKYMSPEQVLCEVALDHRADLWSLAVIAYCLLTGKGPFSATSFEEMARSICEDPVPPPSRQVRYLPPGIDTFFERAFKRSPADRFHSAGQMASAFAAALDAARTGTLPWGTQVPRETPPPPPAAAASAAAEVVAVSPAEKTRPVQRATASREILAPTALLHNGLPIPRSVLPSTYTPTRSRQSNDARSARKGAPKTSWWWAAVPVSLVVVIGAVLFGIAGSSGTGTAGSAASAASVMEIAPTLTTSP